MAEIQNPMDVLEAFPIRKNNKQKKAFRESVMPYIQSLGYDNCHTEGNKATQNIVFGCDPDAAKYIVTAHYDTPASIGLPNFITPRNFWVFIAWQAFLLAIMAALYCGHYSLFCLFIGLMYFGPANKNNANDNTSGVITVLEIAKSLPAELKEQVCFVLFDNEEKGLLGSSNFASKHKKAAKETINLNLDCVGEGDYFHFFPTKPMIKRGEEKLKWLQTCEGPVEGTNKSFTVAHKGFYYYPSDQNHFVHGVGIAALQKHPKIGFYMDKIHTKKDTVLEETNVTILRDYLIQLMQEDKGQHIVHPKTRKETLTEVIFGFLFGLLLVAAFFFGIFMAERDLANEEAETLPTETYSQTEYVEE